MQQLCLEKNWNLSRVVCPERERDFKTVVEEFEDL